MKIEKIRCKELQILDWITDEHGFPMQIVNVGEDYAYATFEGNEGDVWEFNDKDNEPQPIEITDDIFSKNNWKEYSYPSALNLHRHYYVKDESGNRLEWELGTLSIWNDYIQDNDVVYADIIIPCKYVHQLQQALRLAGLHDLANNLKID